MTIPLGGSESDEDMLHTNFLHNTVARIHKYTIQFECQRSGRDSSGARIWEANLFVNEALAATGYGAQKGHAKDEASKTFLVNNGFWMPGPM